MYSIFDNIFRFLTAVGGLLYDILNQVNEILPLQLEDILRFMMFGRSLVSALPQSGNLDGG